MEVSPMLLPALLKARYACSRDSGAGEDACPKIRYASGSFPSVYLVIISLSSGGIWNGKKRIEAIREMLSAIDAEMDNPLNNDAYYGRVDCLLTEMEDLVENFNKTK